MRKRRAVIVFVVGAIVLILFGGALPSIIEQSIAPVAPSVSTSEATSNESATGFDAHKALAELETVSVKGRASKTGYERSEFGDGWSTVNGCSTRNIILYRDLEDAVLGDGCVVVSGKLQDPYSGELIVFTKEKSSMVQIDHVVALSDAWQKGAQQLTIERREQLANDPLELLAVSGLQNQAKGDGDAATWLPKNKAFRCEYVARQIAVKKKYDLWVTDAEKQAIVTVLSSC